MSCLKTKKTKSNTDLYFTKKIVTFSNKKLNQSTMVYQYIKHFFIHTLSKKIKRMLITNEINKCSNIQTNNFVKISLK